MGDDAGGLQLTGGNIDRVRTQAIEPAVSDAATLEFAAVAVAASACWSALSWRCWA